MNNEDSRNHPIRRKAHKWAVTHQEKISYVGLSPKVQLGRRNPTDTDKTGRQEIMFQLAEKEVLSGSDSSREILNTLQYYMISWQVLKRTKVLYAKESRTIRNCNTSYQREWIRDESQQIMLASMVGIFVPWWDK